MNLRSAALAAASGLLLAAAFPSVELPLLAWFAFIPLFHSLKGQTTKNAFWLGGIAGMFFFSGTVYWVTNSVYHYGGIPLIPAVFITLLLCAYLALYPALFSAGFVYLSNKRPSLLIVAAPALWTALELARTYIISGFPWSLLGYSQYRVLPIIQIADLTGVYGVSFLIVMVNTALAALFMNRKQYRDGIIAAVVLASCIGYGFLRLHRAERASGPVMISVIQGNIEQDKKWDPAYQSETISTYEKLSEETLKKHPDLIIWPETAAPFYFTGFNPADRKLATGLIEFVKKIKTPLLFGSPTYEVTSGKRIVLHNSAFLLSNNGKVLSVYHKMHLVPFGEYVPLKKVLFFVEKMVQAIGDFEPGKEYTVMSIPDGASPSREVRFSSPICYEIIFPNLIRQFVDRGAQIITTITNDAWFGTSSAPYQHFSMAVFRAVENRVPIARAANTGVSGFIDAQGNILGASGIFTEASLSQKLYPRVTKTFYTKYGDLFSYACLLLSLTILAVPLKKPTP
jgi:apolipoprotein N-acyltransferase